MHGSSHEKFTFAWRRLAVCLNVCSMKVRGYSISIWYAQYMLRFCTNNYTYNYGTK